MKRSRTVHLKPVTKILALAGLGCLPFTLQGQDALFSSLISERIRAQTKTELANAPYTFKWRELRTVLSASLASEWNDNIQASGATKRSDFSLSPSLSINSLYPITDHNALRINFTTGYQKYVSHTELDRWFLHPGSEIGFDIFVRELRINLHERLSYSEDATRYGAVSGQGTFGGLENAAGIQLSTPLKNMTASLGYDYQTFSSASSSPSKQMNRGSHNVVAQLGVNVHPDVTLGADASAGYTQYQEPILNDNLSISTGPFVHWRASEYVDVEVRAGYVQYTFYGSGATGMLPGYSSFYGNLLMRHRVNRWLSYTLDGGRSSSMGVNANQAERTEANLRFEYKIFSKVSLGNRLSYEKAREFRGLLPQDYDRLGIGVHAGYQILRKLTGSMSYDYLLKNSDVPFFGYAQNRVSLMLTYQF